jgi:tetratricopeptide (TPR) repeat protein
MANPTGDQPTVARPHRRWLNLAYTGVIVAAGWFAFAPALHGDWVWDAIEVVENPLLRNAHGLWNIWFNPVGLYDYYPVKSSIQWLEWQLWGNDTFGYHLVNLGLHLASALLLWRVLRKLGVSWAWLGGLLFTVHPLAVESVGWISELKNALALPPLLAAFSCYLDYDVRGRSRDLVAAVLLFFVAMLCKTSAVMFPVTLLLHGWWKRGRIGAATWKASVPFFALSLILGLVTIWFQRHRAFGDAANEIAALGGAWSRLAVAGPALAFYFAKGLLPLNLMPIYPQWSVAPPTAAHFLPWVALALITFWFWRRRATWGRHALFGGGWFLLHLLPTLGFITMAFHRLAWVSDHLAYASLPGLAGLAAAGGGTLVARLTGFKRTLALAGAGAVLAFCAGQSHGYAGIFRSEEAFWTYAAARNPGAWLAHYNLAQVLFKRGLLAEAIGHYRQAVEIRPEFADAQCSLGIALLYEDQRIEAARHLEAALRARPAMVAAHGALANVLAAQGRIEEAAPHYAAAARLKPADADIQFNWGNALLQAGRFSEAADHLREAVRLNPADTQARAALDETLRHP